MAHTIGIGAAIGCSWSDDGDAYLHGGDLSLPTALRRWFFETAPEPGTLGRVVSALARVTDGWDGTVTITVGDSSHIWTPDARTSVVEVLDEIARVGARRGGTWSWSIDTAGIVTLTASVPFEMVLDGTVRTRLGLTGIYGGQYSATGAEEAYELIQASAGILLDGADGLGRIGGLTQSMPGTLGAVALERQESTGTLSFYGPADELVEVIQAGLGDGTFDVGHGDQWAGRVRVRSIERRPRGVSKGRWMVTASVVAVS